MVLKVRGRLLSLTLVLALSVWTVPTALAQEAAGGSGAVPDGTSAQTASAEGASGEAVQADEAASSDKGEAAPSDEDGAASSDEGAPSLPGGGEAAGDGAAQSFEGGWVIRALCGEAQVVDVAGGSADDGANVQTYRSNMSSAQRFLIEVGEDGYAVVSNEKTGKVLDVAGGVAKAGTNVQMYERNGSDAQRWRIEDDGSGGTVFVSALDESLVLDVDGGRDADGSNVGLWTRNGSPAQSFELISDEPRVEPGVKLEPGVYAVESGMAGGLVLDVEGASVSNGAKVQLWGRNGSPAQMFLAVVDDEGFLVLSSVNSGKALDVASGNLVPGAKVQQWDRQDGNVNQRWVLRARDDGAFELVSCANGLVLDARGGADAPGTALQTYSPNGTRAQAWTLAPVDRLVQDGVYTLASLLDPSLVLDVKDASFADGAAAQVWSRNDSPAQKFRIVAEGAAEGTDAPAEGPAGQVSIQPLTAGGQYLTAREDGSVAFCARDGEDRASQLWIPSAAACGGVVFVNASTGMALDVTGAGAWAGCPVGSYGVNGTAAQSFRPLAVDLVSNGTYVFQFLSDGRVLDVSGGSRSNGANVQAWSQNGSGAQAWTVEGTGDGFFKIVNARSKKALDVSGGVSASGTNVQQWAQDDVAAQKWRFELDDDGAYVLVSACGGFVLDLAGGGGQDGANVQVYERNGSKAQSLRLVPTNYVPEDFEDLIATFTTYSTNTPAGTYNMQRALNSFDGVVVQPGASLSFFAVAGPCGAAEGYLPAGVVGGIGYGGGICQASTTLYGAAIRAGFAILDRQNHSVPSTYVPIGLDAMVNWGTSDLVVRNDTGYPVKIVVHTYGNVLTCEMWGIQPDWYDSVEPSSWYTGPSSAAAQRTYYKDGRAVLTQALPSSWYW